MWFGSREEEVRRLEAEARARLERGQLDEATALADRLLALGWSGGFEVKALALQRGGALEGAIELLEEAVAKVPGAAALWLLLGNLRSDAGRLDSAIEALDRALACEDAPAAVVRFNRAVARHRHGDPGGALDDLEPILALPTPPPFAEDALALAAACLAELGRAADGVALVEAAREACAADDPRRPRLDAELALALDRAGRDARAPFTRATDAGVATPGLLALGRRLLPVVVEAPRRFRLVVSAPTPTREAAGLVRVFDVVAADPDHALELARRHLPADARDGATVERCEPVEAEEAEKEGALEPGVHGASALAFYDEP